MQNNENQSFIVKIVSNGAIHRVTCESYLALSNRMEAIFEHPMTCFTVNDLTGQRVDINSEETFRSAFAQFANDRNVLRIFADPAENVLSEKRAPHAFSFGHNKHQHQQQRHGPPPHAQARHGLPSHAQARHGLPSHAQAHGHRSQQHVAPPFAEASGHASQRLSVKEKEEAGENELVTVELAVGPLWNNDHAQHVGRMWELYHPGSFTGHWKTTVWGKMSVIQVRMPTAHLAAARAELPLDLKSPRYAFPPAKPDVKKCAGCAFSVHSTGKVGGGTSCCNACAMTPGKHGPMCEGSKFIPKCEPKTSDQGACCRAARHQHHHHRRRHHHHREDRKGVFNFAAALMLDAKIAKASERLAVLDPASTRAQHLAQRLELLRARRAAIPEQDTTSSDDGDGDATSDSDGSGSDSEFLPNEKQEHEHQQEEAFALRCPGCKVYAVHSDPLIGYHAGKTGKFCCNACARTHGRHGRRCEKNTA